MKYLKSAIIAVLVVAMSLTVTGQVLARGGGHHGGYGSGMATGSSAGNQVVGNNYGSANGDCPYGTLGNFVNIFEDAPPVTVTGTVSEVLYYGGGLLIATHEETVAIYGMGPFWYWNQLEVDRPAVNDEVVVEGYEITDDDGNARIIATNITVNGTDVALRDQETGAPLWRGNRSMGGGRGMGQGMGVCPWAPELPVIED